MVFIQSMDRFMYFGAVFAFIVGFTALPFSAHAVDVSESCPVVIDNDTTEWLTVDALVSSEGTTVGVDYYWTGTEWVTTEPSSYTYSTNVQQMADLENIKVCNDVTSMYLYVDAQHPMFALYDTAAEEYVEFGDPNDAANPGMPEAFDYWMVYEMQKVGSNNIYYYGIHLVTAVGDPGLQSGPTKHALYEDDGDGVFNPNTDTELAEFDTGGNEVENGEQGEGEVKAYDQEGGLEVALDLINADGEGVFTLTDISYGDTVTMSVAMYSGSGFASTGILPIGPAAVDETDSFEYTVAAVGVQNVIAPKKHRKKKSVKVKWDAVSIADGYDVWLYSNKGKKLREFSTTKLGKTFKKLKKGKYSVKVRATIGTIITPWSDAKKFKTAK